LGANLIAFNAGDGRDLIHASTGADNVLSLGGGIDYADLRLKKSGADLILKTGGSDQLTFADWYTSTGTGTSKLTLQVIAEAMAGYDPAGYDPAGSDTLRDNKVEHFNFAALAAAFDTAGQVNGWALTQALLDAHLLGSDSDIAALGGDLAYQYGKVGSLSGIGLVPAQDVINASGFATGPQTLRPVAELQQGPLRLS
jgi:hypothetical protein